MKESSNPGPFRVALAQFPGGGSQRLETNAWVVRTVRKMDQDPSVAAVVSLTYNDTPITMTRNRAVREARAASADYLLMVDSDMSPDLPYAASEPFWDVAWKFMMDRRRVEADRQAGKLTKYLPGESLGGSPFDVVQPATVAAPYCGPPPNECCYVFHWASDESETPNPNFRLEMVSREQAATKWGVQEAAALPTGLILYDLRVFDTLPFPWFRYEYTDKYESEKATTEDVYQTRNASLMGLPQFCAWNCWAGHIKTKVVGKPLIVTRDQVHRSLVEAVRRGVDSDDRLVMLAPPAAHASTDAPIEEEDTLGL